MPSKTHGMSGSRLYYIWSTMRQRCNNPNNHKYKNYGDRGIKICNEWNLFENFMAWALSNGYSDELTIERINVNGNYEPCNCKWVTNDEQQRNKRNNKYLILKGEKRTLSEWSRITGLNHTTILKRLKIGWSVEDALLIPKLQTGKNRSQMEV